MPKWLLGILGDIYNVRSIVKTFLPLGFPATKTVTWQYLLHRPNTMLNTMKPIYLHRSYFGTHLLCKGTWNPSYIFSCFCNDLCRYMVIANHFGEKYTRLRRPVCRSNHNSIFDRVGVMLQGKHSFCTRLAKVVQVHDLFSLCHQSSIYLLGVWQF